jgi:hypothetical protein
MALYILIVYHPCITILHLKLMHFYAHNKEVHYLVEINSILLVQKKEKERNNKRVSNHETNLLLLLYRFQYLPKKASNRLILKILGEKRQLLDYPHPTK